MSAPCPSTISLPSGLSFALATGLWTLVVRAATSLRQDTVLLNLAVEAFQG